MAGRRQRLDIGTENIAELLALPGVWDISFSSVQAEKEDPRHNWATMALREAFAPLTHSTQPDEEPRVHICIENLTLHQTAISDSRHAETTGQRRAVPFHAASTHLQVDGATMVTADGLSVRAERLTLRPGFASAENLHVTTPEGDVANVDIVIRSERNTVYVDVDQRPLESSRRTEVASTIILFGAVRHLVNLVAPTDPTPSAAEPAAVEEEEKGAEEEEKGAGAAPSNPELTRRAREIVVSGFHLNLLGFRAQILKLHFPHDIEGQVAAFEAELSTIATATVVRHTEAAKPRTEPQGFHISAYAHLQRQAPISNITTTTTEERPTIRIQAFVTNEHNAVIDVMPVELGPETFRILLAELGNLLGSAARSGTRIGVVLRSMQVTVVQPCTSMEVQERHQEPPIQQQHRPYFVQAVKDNGGCQHKALFILRNVVADVRKETAPVIGENPTLCGLPSDVLRINMEKLIVRRNNPSCIEEIWNTVLDTTVLIAATGGVATVHLPQPVQLSAIRDVFVMKQMMALRELTSNLRTLVLARRVDVTIPEGALRLGYVSLLVTEHKTAPSLHLRVGTFQYDTRVHRQASPVAFASSHGHFRDRKNALQAALDLAETSEPEGAAAHAATASASAASASASAADAAEARAKARAAQILNGLGSFAGVDSIHRIFIGAKEATTPQLVALLAGFLVTPAFALDLLHAFADPRTPVSAHATGVAAAAAAAGDRTRITKPILSRISIKLCNTVLNKETTHNHSGIESLLTMLAGCASHNELHTLHINPFRIRVSRADGELRDFRDAKISVGELEKRCAMGAVPFALRNHISSAIASSLMPILSTNSFDVAGAVTAIGRSILSPTRLPGTLLGAAASIVAMPVSVATGSIAAISGAIADPTVITDPLRGLSHEGSPPPPPRSAEWFQAIRSDLASSVEFVSGVTGPSSDFVYEVSCAGSRAGKDLLMGFVQTLASPIFSVVQIARGEFASALRYAAMSPLFFVAGTVKAVNDIVSAVPMAFSHAMLHGVVVGGDGRIHMVDDMEFATTAAREVHRLANPHVIYRRARDCVSRFHESAGDNDILFHAAMCLQLHSDPATDSDPDTLPRLLRVLRKYQDHRRESRTAPYGLTPTHVDVLFATIPTHLPPTRCSELAAVAVGVLLRIARETGVEVDQHEDVTACDIDQKLFESEFAAIAAMHRRFALVKPDGSVTVFGTRSGVALRSTLEPGGTRFGGVCEIDIITSGSPKVRLLSWQEVVGGDRTITFARRMAFERMKNALIWSGAAFDGSSASMVNNRYMFASSMLRGLLLEEQIAERAAARRR